jgi:hypothetical protein
MQPDERHQPVQCGEIVWVWPEQFELDGEPRGFALRVNRFMGRADERRFGVSKVWVVGWRFDNARSDFDTVQPLTLVIHLCQTRAVLRNPSGNGSTPAFGLMIRALPGGPAAGPPLPIRK